MRLRHLGQLLWGPTGRSPNRPGVIHDDPGRSDFSANKALISQLVEPTCVSRFAFAIVINVVCAKRCYQPSATKDVKCLLRGGPVHNDPHQAVLTHMPQKQIFNAYLPGSEPTIGLPLEFGRVATRVKRE